LAAARIGLRDVGPGALADIQPVIRGPHLLAQEVEILRAQADDRLGLRDIHESCDRVEEHVLLGAAKGFAAGEDRGLRGAHRILRAEAEEDRLLDGNAKSARIGRARTAGAGIGVVDAGVGIGEDRWPVTGPGARHILVRGAQFSARRVQLRIVRISP
jgi:hypothetical protein